MSDDLSPSVRGYKDGYNTIDALSSSTRVKHSVQAAHFEPVSRASFLTTIVVAGLLIYHYWLPISGVEHGPTLSNPFTIPIIQELETSLTRMEIIMHLLWAALEGIPADSAGITRLQKHVAEAHMSIRSAEGGNNRFLRSLDQVEESFTSIDFDGFYDSVALCSSPSSALQNSIEGIKDVKIESRNKISLLMMLLHDIENSRPPLRLAKTSSSQTGRLVI